MSYFCGGFSYYIQGYEINELYKTIILLEKKNLYFDCLKYNLETFFYTTTQVDPNGHYSNLVNTELLHGF